MSTEKTQNVRTIFDAIKERKGFTKDTELAEWLDVKKQTMAAWEARGRIANYEPFTQRGLNEDWLRTGTGPMFEEDRDEPAFLRRARPDKDRPAEAFDVPSPKGRIPIISWVQAGTDGFFEYSYSVGSGYAEINRPYDVTDPGAYALIVVGNSMSPRYEPGDILLVSPNGGVRTGSDAVVKLRGGEVMVKRVVAKDDHYILESFNPEFPPIECPTESVVFVHRVVWVKRGE